MVGCGSPRAGAIDPETLAVFPAPPDTARIQFLTRFGNSRDIVPAGGGLARLLTGEDQSGAGQPIRKPYGVAIAGGKLYVCDTAPPGIEVFDLRAKAFQYWSPGTGSEGLQSPINCEIDRSSGYLYVSDTQAGRVLVYDTSGRLVHRIGDGKGKPGDVVVTGDTVWVTDLTRKRIELYDRDSRELLGTFPDSTAGSLPALAQPVNIAVRDSLVYVSDFLGFTVKVYTRDGRYLRQVGALGRGPGQFARPKGLDVDREHVLYVVDAAFENVQMFDAQGRLLMAFGGPYQRPGDMYLPAQVTIDYENLEYFQKYVNPRFTLKYLILVTNQYGPDKVSVYGRVEPKTTP